MLADLTNPRLAYLLVPPKKKSKAQREAERLQAEEEERRAEILRAKREAERQKKELEDAERLKEKQVAVEGNVACIQQHLRQ